MAKRERDWARTWGPVTVQAEALQLTEILWQTRRSVTLVTRTREFSIRSTTRGSRRMLTAETRRMQARAKWTPPAS